MEMSAQAMRLKKLRLGDFKPLFATLFAPAVSSVHGQYEAELVGPDWLQKIARPALYLGGLGGWCGKWFDGSGNGHNLVRRKGNIRPVVSIIAQQRPSYLDGKTSLMIIYPPSSRFPWPWIVDELRVLDRYTLLGMMVVTQLGLYQIGFPFLLHTTREAGEFTT